MNCTILTDNILKETSTEIHINFTGSVAVLATHLLHTQVCTFHRYRTIAEAQHTAGLNRGVGCSVLMGWYEGLKCLDWAHTQPFICIIQTCTK